LYETWKDSHGNLQNALVMEDNGEVMPETHSVHSSACLTSKITQQISVKLDNAALHQTLLSELHFGIN